MKILWKDKFIEKDKIVYWIREWFEVNGDENTKAIIGISGGKDSTVAAALCVEALGKNRVVGVLMPKGEQRDIEDAKNVTRLLDIKSKIIDIEPAYNKIEVMVRKFFNYEEDCKKDVLINIQPRIRMTLLYAIAAQYGNARVVCTDNASESYVGYSTKFGDLAGDLAPLAEVPASLVVDIGRAIAYTIPELLPLVEKTPSDGLSGKTDEDALGFSYNQLDNYLFNSEYVSADIADLIETRHRNNLHKNSIVIPRYHVTITDTVNTDEDAIYVET